MFNNRKRQTSAIHLPKSHNAPPPASSAAHSAAAQAFLKTQSSTPTLSASAAAAALKRYPSPATNVADAQTKRSLNRRGSVSSIRSTGTAMSATGSTISLHQQYHTGAQQNTPTLRPSSSSGRLRNGSMRGTSPARSMSLSGVFGRREKAPPVPPLPPVVNQEAVNLIKQRQRASSFEQGLGNRTLRNPLSEYALRQRVLSYQEEKSEQPSRRNNSIDDGNRMVNFSRPMSPPPSSPTTRAETPISPTVIKETQQVSPPTPKVQEQPRPASPTAPLGLPEYRKRQGGGWHQSGSSSGPLARQSSVSSQTSQINHQVDDNASLLSRSSSVSATQSSKWSSPYMHAGTKPFDPEIPSSPEKLIPSPSLTVQPTNKTEKHNHSSSNLFHSSKNASKNAPQKNWVPTKVNVPINIESPQPIHSPVQQLAQAANLERKPMVEEEEVQQSQRQSTTTTQKTKPALLPAQIINVQPPTPDATADDDANFHLPHFTESQPHTIQRQSSPSVVVPPPQSSVKVSTPMTVHQPSSRTASPTKSALRNSPSVSPRLVAAVGDDAFHRTSIEKTKNDTPPRTTSPFKSALKQTRGPSPSISSLDDFNLQETPSHDIPKKKKSVRINIDVIPGGKDEEDGMSSSRYAPPTPVKSNFIATAQKPKFDNEIEDIMKPRSALPSFASIRSNAQEKDSSNRNSYLEDSTAANDHAIGGILRQAPLAGKGARREDSETAKIAARRAESEKSSVSNSEAQLPSTPTPISANKVDEPLLEGEPTVVETLSNDEESSLSKENVEKEKQVATFNQKLSHGQDEDDSVFIPGAFPDDEEAIQVSSERAGVVFAPISEAEEDSDSDNSSVYSDAEENLNDGFASLDTIMEEATPSAIEEASRQFNEYDDSPKQSSKDRDSNYDLEVRLEEARKNKEDLEAQSQPQDDTSMSNDIPVIKPPQPKTKEDSTRPITSTQQSKFSTEQSKAIAPRSYYQETIIGAASDDLEPSSPLSSSRWSVSNKSHGSTVPAKTSRTKSAISPDRASSKWGRDASPITAIIPTSLRRKNSNDSVSSFKRSRASPPPVGRVTMRSSMRSSSVGHRPMSPPRPLSPTGSVMSDRQHSLRTSLRDKQKPAPVQRRFSSDSKSGNRLSSFIKSSKTKATRAFSPKRNNNSTSRFANDSDDETGPSHGSGRVAFKSRFDHDSDDEIAHPASPPLRESLQAKTLRKQTGPQSPERVRGVPRTRFADDDSSTDLEGENDERLHRIKSIPPVPSFADVERAHTPSPPIEKQRKKQPSNNTVGLDSSRYAAAAASATNVTIAGGSLDRSQGRRWHSIAKWSNQNSSPSRGASPDANLASKLPMKLRKTRPGLGSPMPSYTSVSGSGNQWPLPSPPIINPDDRPMSSEGKVTGARPRTRIEMGKRRSTADGVLGVKVASMLKRSDDHRLRESSTANYDIADGEDINNFNGVGEGFINSNGLGSFPIKPVAANEKKKRWQSWKKMVPGFK